MGSTLLMVLCVVSSTTVNGKFLFNTFLEKLREGEVTREGGGAHWTYSGETGPSNWGHFSPICASGHQQSPINILHDHIVNHKAQQSSKKVGVAALKGFTWIGYDVMPSASFVVNNGHTAQVGITQDPMPVVFGGGLDGHYIFAQLHFHWGSDSSKGSEHLIDGGAAPLEMHLVHYKKAYGSIGEALKHFDGLAVFSVMFQVGETPFPAVADLVSNFGAITNPGGDKAPLATIHPIKDYLPADTRSFFRYHGSLTTPPCSEAAVWTVFADRPTVTEDHLAQFRGLKDSEGNALVNNFRPTQDMYGRTVSV